MRIFAGEDAALHRSKFRMIGEEALDLIEVIFRDDQVVVEENQNVAGGALDGEILYPAFSRLRLEDTSSDGSRIRQLAGPAGSAVFGDDQLASRGTNLRLQLGDQAREPF